MRFNVITLFPQMIEDALKHGVIGQALSSQKISLQTVNPRTFTSDRHHTVDDRPFGGGDGMVMLYEPLKQAMLAVDQLLSAVSGSVSGTVTGSVTEGVPRAGSRRVLLSAHGEKWSDGKAREWAAGFQSQREAGKKTGERSYSAITLVCGRYGGIDQRFINEFIDEEISVGDYILSGGELAALTIIDSVTRLLPEVLGNADSPQFESFAQEGLLEAPQFTRPQVGPIPLGPDMNQGSADVAVGENVAGESLPAVPRVLVSGDHKRIAQARRVLSLLITAQNRPDLLTQFHRDEILRSSVVLKEFSYEELKVCGLTDAFLDNIVKS